MKTTNDILTDFWNVISASPIVDLSGGVYKKTRPTDSKLEDCVFHLITGNNSKFLQDGALYVKIYYLDLFSNNTHLEDLLRGSLLEGLLIDLSETLLNTNGYSFDVQSRETYTEGVQDLYQHFAILKMNFKLTID